MNHFLRMLFFAIVVRPIMLVILGMNIRNREKLPDSGPAILVANHNSHLDVLALMCLFPLKRLRKLRPVAAQDYFFRNPFIKWFALRIMAILPLDREVKKTRTSPLAGIYDAIERKEIIILFPEGSRGEPEELGRFKTGIAHIAKKHPEVPIIPCFMHGMGKALPKGEALLVPFFLDVFVGEPLDWEGEKSKFMESLTCQMTALAAQGDFPPWE